MVAYNKNRVKIGLIALFMSMPFMYGATDPMINAEPAEPVPVTRNLAIIDTSIINLDDFEPLTGKTYQELIDASVLPNGICMFAQVTLERDGHPVDFVLYDAYALNKHLFGAIGLTNQPVVFLHVTDPVTGTVIRPDQITYYLCGNDSSMERYRDMFGRRNYVKRCIFSYKGSDLLNTQFGHYYWLLFLVTQSEDFVLKAQATLLLANIFFGNNPLPNERTRAYRDGQAFRFYKLAVRQNYDMDTKVQAQNKIVQMLLQNRGEHGFPEPKRLTTAERFLNSLAQQDRDERIKMNAFLTLKRLYFGDFGLLPYSKERRYSLKKLSVGYLDTVADNAKFPDLQMLAYIELSRIHMASSEELAQARTDLDNAFKLADALGNIGMIEKINKLREMLDKAEKKVKEEKGA